MTTQVHVTVKFPAVSGVPKDATVHDWTFSQRPGGGEPDWSAVVGANLSAQIKNFYNVASALHGTSQPIGYYLSQQLSRTANAVELNFYDIDAGPGHSPIYSDIMTLHAAAAGSQPEPAQVALCLSWHADETDTPEHLGPTRPAERKRGRIFIGPLNTAASDVSGSLSIPILTFRNDLWKQVSDMWDNEDWDISVWSRRDTSGAHPFGTCRRIQQVWIDNRWDTQRRRLEAATSRVQATLL